MKNNEENNSSYNYKLIPIWHFWDPGSGMIGGMIGGIIITIIALIGKYFFS